MDAVADATPTDPRPAATPLRRWGAWLIAGLGLWAYWPTLGRVASAWVSDPDYSHGFFVAPIAWWLWRHRRPVVGPSAARGTTFAGGDGPPRTTAAAPAERGAVVGSVAALLLAGGMRFAAARFYLPELDAWSIPIWISGVVLLLGGVATWRAAGVAIGFLWFAAPLPATVELALSGSLQHLAAQLSGLLLQTLGRPALVEGSTILLGDQVLDVERACSGLRIFYGVFALSVAVVAVVRPPRWQAIAILLASVPAAIAANVARVTVTGLLYEFSSGKLARRFSHDFAGILTIPLALLLFAALCWLLRAVERRRHLPQPIPVRRWVVAAALGVLAVGTITWWSVVQQEEAIETLRVRAEQLADRQDYRGAYDYFNRYAAARPANRQAAVRLAEVYEHLAHDYASRRQLVRLFRRAWRLVPENVSLAERAAATAQAIEDHGQAVEICDAALAGALTDSQRARLLQLKCDSIWAYMLWDNARSDHTWQDVRQALEAAAALPRYEVRHASALAHLLRDPGKLGTDQIDATRADELTRNMTRDYPDKSTAWLAQYRYRRRFVAEDVEFWESTLEQDLQRALQLGRSAGGRQGAEVLLTAAQESLRAGQEVRADAYLREAAELAPTDHRSYLQRSEIRQERGGPQAREEAIAILREASRASPVQELAVILPLASLLAEQGRLEEAAGYMQPLQEQIPRIVGPRQAIARLGVELVQAQILQARQGPGAALAHLQALVQDPQIQRAGNLAPDLYAQAWSLLGRSCMRLDSPDKGSDAFRQASLIAPDNPAVIAELAAATLDAGDLPAAERAYLRHLELRPDDPSTLLALAGIEIRRQLRLELPRRNWRRAQRALKRAREASAEGPQLKLLEAELASAEGDLPRATQILVDAIAQFPNEAVLRRGLVVMLGRENELEQALAAARDYRSRFPASVDGAALEAELLVRRGESEAALALLEGVRRAATGAQLPDAALAVARLRMQRGETELAIQALDEAHAAAPQNIRLVEFAARLTALVEQWDQLQTYEQQLRQIEGPGGALWRAYRIERLIAQARLTSDPEFQEAARLVDELQTIRPRWSQTHFLRGEVARRLDRVGAAILAYEEAWELGGQNMLIADRLIELFTLNGRYDEAERYVRQIRGFLSVSARLFDRAVPYYARSEQRAEALALAEQWVARRPDDPFTHIRLGRVLTILADTLPDDTPDPSQQARELLARAAQEFQLAISLEPADVRPWIASVMFFAKYEDNPRRAIEIMRQLSDRSEIDLLHRSYVLAQLSEALGQDADAQHFYQEAVRLAREDPDEPIGATVLGRAALFYASRVPVVAEVYATEALARDPLATSAKQALIEVDARRGDRQSLARAFKLLDDDQPIPEGELSNNQRRLRASLLLQDGRPEEIRRGIRLLEEVLQPTRDDRALLARLYERGGHVGLALDTLRSLTTAARPRPKDLIQFVNFWQTHFVANSNADLHDVKFAHLASQVYEQLEQDPQQAPEALRLRIREARILSPGAQIEPQRLRQLIGDQFQASADRQTDPQAREALRRKLLFQIHRVLLEESELETALDLAAEPPEGISRVDAVIYLLHALTVVPTPPMAEDPCRARLEELVARLDYDVDLVQAAGDYHFMARRYSEAAAAYRAVLTHQPERNLATNNLVLALAEIASQRGMAREILQTAVDRSPSDLRLVDTQAVLALIEGKPRESLRLLQEVDRAYKADPVTYLHMAAAYEVLQDEDSAAAWLLRSLALGIETQVLSPRDRAYLQRALRKHASRLATSANASTAASTTATLARSPREDAPPEPQP